MKCFAVLEPSFIRFVWNYPYGLPDPRDPSGKRGLLFGCRKVTPASSRSQPGLHVLPFRTNSVSAEIASDGPRSVKSPVWRLPSFERLKTTVFSPSRNVGASGRHWSRHFRASDRKFKFSSKRDLRRSTRTGKANHSKWTRSAPPFKRTKQWQGQLSSLLVVNHVVPETRCQPSFDVRHLFTQTGVNSKDVVSWIKAQIDVSEIQEEELHGAAHQPPVQAKCIAEQHLVQPLFFGLGLAGGDI